MLIPFSKGNKKMLKKKFLGLEDNPDNLKEEISFLYDLGIKIEDIEYLLEQKSKPS